MSPQQHWSQAALHKFERDVFRLKDVMARANLHFVKKHEGDGFQWTVPPPPHRNVHRTVYIFADASHKDSGWGGSVLVIDSLGHLWLRDRVCVRAIGLSTTLVEASMIVGAVRAVVRCILWHMISVGSLWPWSDSLEGFQGIQSIRLSNKAASIMDRVVAHAAIEGFSIHWSWVQAQHDSKKVDWISRCNGIVDADANLAADGDA